MIEWHSHGQEDNNFETLEKDQIIDKFRSHQKENNILFSN